MPPPRLRPGGLARYILAGNGAAGGAAASAPRLRPVKLPGYFLAGTGAACDTPLSSRVQPPLARIQPAVSRLMPPFRRSRALSAIHAPRAGPRAQRQEV